MDCARTIPDSRSGDDAARAQKAPRIKRRGEPIDAYVAAAGRRMDEVLIVNDDADMQFLVREMHENEIAGTQFAPWYGQAGAYLFMRGARHMNPGAIRRVLHQSAALEAAGRRSAVSIGLAHHGQGETNHVRAWGG